jgi:hypothetical protein
MSNYQAPFPVRQSDLLTCIVANTFKDNDFEKTQKALEFMTEKSEAEQWNLCRARIIEAKVAINKVIENEKWPCRFPKDSESGPEAQPNQLLFTINSPDKNIGFNRIALGIGPDTYCSHYMETALLRQGTRDFLDKYGYQSQDLLCFQTIDDLIGELRRLVKIYQNGV